jgi:4-aminobutyrate aminotransferase/(S)-3-amino-2-methylpropionate transaminase
VAETESVTEADDALPQQAPAIVVRPPGPHSRTWLTRDSVATAPMGPRRTPEISPGIQADVPPGSVVYATAAGSNVVDVDGNRYVDLCAGFGAQLLGHRHPYVQRVLELQVARLWQALGDVYPGDAKIALSERLAKLHPSGKGRVILGLSGADAVSAALKTAVLHTGKSGVLAFGASYHGLSHGPLAACGLRGSYRLPFADQLNPHVTFLPYPEDEQSAARILEQARAELRRGVVGAVLVEPILGRGGCIVPPPAFLPALLRLGREHGAVGIADEIWTALGRSGSLLVSAAAAPDLICLGKGLGGGLPISACLGSAEVMAAWSRDAEVVHTSTFAGAPLTCATALATLDVLSRERLPERAASVGARFLDRLRSALPARFAVRGQGLMVGVDTGGGLGGAQRVQRALLERGYIVSSGGGGREVLILTPPLTIAEALLDGFIDVLLSTLQAFAPSELA